MAHKRENWKADSSEMEKRINECYLLILQGHNRKFIIRYFAENYKIGERQVENYLNRAREEISKEYTINTEYKKNEILAQYYDLYNKAYNEEDYKLCQSILKDIGGIFGVDAVKKIDLTTEGEKITQTPTIIFTNSQNE
jgi:hypothetical protein